MKQLRTFEVEKKTIQKKKKNHENVKKNNCLVYSYMKKEDNYPIDSTVPRYRTLNNNKCRMRSRMRVQLTTKQHLLFLTSLFIVCDRSNKVLSKSGLSKKNLTMFFYLNCKKLNCNFHLWKILLKFNPSLCYLMNLFNKSSSKQIFWLKSEHTW